MLASTSGGLALLSKACTFKREDSSFISLQAMAIGFVGTPSAQRSQPHQGMGTQSILNGTSSQMLQGLC